jgi:hypothetical protein
MARQEARLIGFLAETLREVAPDVTLLVRPYPMLADTDFFRALRDRPNVRFDEDYRRGRKDRSLTRDAIFERLNLQEHSLAFVHCGTTMGLEGAYFDAPVLILDLDDIDYGLPAGAFMHLRGFIHQYQNEKYLLLRDFPNTIGSAAQLRDVLAALLGDPAPYRAYNRRIAGGLQPKPLDEISRDFFRLSVQPAVTVGDGMPRGA